jgi:hypothetical protein
MSSSIVRVMMSIGLLWVGNMVAVAEDTRRECKELMRKAFAENVHLKANTDIYT